MAADLESEETCCHSKEGVCGSQWPNFNSYKFRYHSFCLYIDRSKHAGIIYFLVLVLALWRQSGELYGTVSSIKMISLALTMTN